MILSAPIAKTNQWDYYVVMKTGNAWSLHFNGAQQATATSTDTWGANTTGLTIGNDPDKSYDDPCVAYLDEMRLSHVARYSGTITNPTAPFTLD